MAERRFFGYISPARSFPLISIKCDLESCPKAQKVRQKELDRKKGREREKEYVTEKRNERELLAAVHSSFKTWVSADDP